MANIEAAFEKHLEVRTPVRLKVETGGGDIENDFGLESSGGIGMGQVGATGWRECQRRDQLHDCTLRHQDRGELRTHGS